MNGLFLKRYRKKANLTQKQIADKLNISVSLYSRWENDKRVPDAYQLLDLSNVLGCTPNDLYGIKGAMSVSIDPLFQEYKELVEKIKK